jgi:phosphopantothenoylcysteine decarboxylase/phosphopantothenate--cysteine ligase
MAAAVSDFRPSSPSDTKLKKTKISSPSIELIHNPDLLMELVQNRTPGQVIIGFAAETGDTHADVITYGQQKLKAKGCDALVINSVADGKGFESLHNEVTIVQPEAAPIEILHTTKELIAETVWHVVTSLWDRQ